MRRLTPALFTLAATAALLAPAQPAAADSETFPDGKATEGSMDIHRVSVVNEKRLQIRVKVDDLQNEPGPSASAYIDVDTDHAGPDFVITSGLVDSDWQISRADGWKPDGDPLSCPVDQRLRFDDDVISWTTGPKCLGSYEEVRVSVKTTSDEANDWSPDRRKFHPWVDRF